MKGYTSAEENRCCEDFIRFFACKIAILISAVAKRMFLTLHTDCLKKSSVYRIYVNKLLTFKKEINNIC